MTARQAGLVRCPRRRAQLGNTLVEVLVSMVVGTFGMLGFVGLQTRAVGAEMEAQQRSQALLLVGDMVSRIHANRGEADSYVTPGRLGSGDPLDCSGRTGANLDVCQWSNLIRGVNQVSDGERVGLQNARGCIVRLNRTSGCYGVTVSWQGVIASGAPANTCGRGDAALPDERLRRTVGSTVCIAALRGENPQALTCGSDGEGGCEANGADREG